MIAAAIDDEAERTLTSNTESAAALSPESSIDATAQRTVSIDDLVTDAHPVPFAAKIAGATKMVTEAGAGTLQLDVSQELSPNRSAEHVLKSKWRPRWCPSCPGLHLLVRCDLESSTRAYKLSETPLGRANCAAPVFWALLRGTSPCHKAKMRVRDLILKTLLKTGN